MNKQDIINWLDKYNIKNYTINEDLTVDVDGNVNLYSKGLTEIPVQFNKINGNFGCSDNKLTSLKGFPKEVNGYFWCSVNKLTTLEYGPEIINGDFCCSYNPFKSFTNWPKHINCWNELKKHLNKDQLEELLIKEPDWLEVII